MSDNPGRHNAAALRLEYDGELGALYRIFLVNLGLTVITLGIFRFWAKTRMRRYLWAHMRFGGERFEYTGTGGEKFRGFLLAILVLSGVFVAAFAVAFLQKLLHISRLQLLNIPISLFYGSLFGAAVYSAQRYRLTRTSWRGIRGGMETGALNYGFRAVGYWTLISLSLGFAWPVYRLRLLRHRLNASAFGSASLSVRGRPAALYPAFLFGVLACVVIAAVLAAIGGLLFRAQLMTMPAAARSELGGQVFAVGAFVFWGVSRLAMAWFDAALARQILGSMALGDIRFATEITGGALFRLRLGNTLISAFTLGLGGPIITQRCARFLCAQVQVLGSPDLDGLLQNDMPVPSRGEGLLEALDAGIGG